MAKGKFASQRQRRFLWARMPALARAWAHGRSGKGLGTNAKPRKRRGKR
jgi:hypothetical protein